ncbi:NAD-dependent epimerase/dehydratase family protein [Candidatus Pelagibacter ubique]|nr:NAD-dependent epimerase/dehydratase family protein [Candidatus Pelagibacter ubique]|tara:strand:+ start:1943 stop:2884 length:942 start_codon:yes stop_codon:yes gene_type:complete
MISFLKNKKISVTGGEGFLGGHLIRLLEKKNPKTISIVRHSEYDLVNGSDVQRMYKDQSPDIVFHLAATVGGIGVNQRNPGKFFYENAVMNLQVIHNAYLTNVEKIISIGTVSVYPDNTTIPFEEKNIWKGYPQEDNAPYGIAKRIMHTHSLSYRKQYNFNSIMMILTNLYGPGDNFNKDTSHVIAALIRRFYEAKKNNEKEVKVWGDGNSTRDFCYIEDIANGIILAGENYNESEPLNLASGREVAIKELVMIVKKQMNYEGKIIWDKDMPIGPNRRNINIQLAKTKIDYDPKISLEDGIQRTIDYYINLNK